MQKRKRLGDDWGATVAYLCQLCTFSATSQKQTTHTTTDKYSQMRHIIKIFKRRILESEWKFSLHQVASEYAHMDLFNSRNGTYLIISTAAEKVRLLFSPYPHHTTNEKMNQITYKKMNPATKAGRINPQLEYWILDQGVRS
jgi:hypothetical protein